MIFQLRWHDPMTGDTIMVQQFDGDYLDALARIYGSIEAGRRINARILWYAHLMKASCPAGWHPQIRVWDRDSSLARIASLIRGAR